MSKVGFVDCAVLPRSYREKRSSLAQGRSVTTVQTFSLDSAALHGKADTLKKLIHTPEGPRTDSATFHTSPSLTRPKPPVPLYLTRCRH